jgi:hypothetical protein
VSDAWNRFLQQYNAEGAERLDGYLPSHFEALTEAERERARAMVLARAETGETPEIRALPLVGGAAALRCVEGLMARERGPTLVRLAACEAGWAMTKSPGYQHAMLAIAEQGDAFVRARAIVALCALPLTPGALDGVVAMLRTEEDEALTVQLAKGVLRSRGIAVDTMQEFVRALPLVRALSAPNLHDRGEALNRVDALVANARTA